MKILIVSQHFHPEPFRINDIAKELVNLGHEVTVLTGLPNYPSGVIPKEYRGFKKRKENYFGVQIIRTSIFARGKSLIRMGLNYLSFAINASIKSIFINEKYDVIFSFQTSPISMVLPAISYKLRHGTPIVLYCLDQWPISLTTGPFNENSLSYTLFYHLSRWIYRKSDLILLSSQSFISYFENVLKIHSTEKGLVYWPSYAEKIYQEIEYVKNGKFDLLFAGNVGPAQNVEFIVEAANKLKSNSNIHFHIVGDGLNLVSCKQLASIYKLENITFYGHFPVERMPEFYSIADVFLITMVDNPVVNQTLPAKLQSYMAANKPIIGAINGEVRNVIESAKCGLVSNSNDLNSFVNNIIKAYNNPDYHLAWAKNGYDYYSNNFNKDLLMDKLIRLFDELIERGEQDATN